MFPLIFRDVLLDPFIQQLLGVLHLIYIEAYQLGWSCFCWLPAAMETSLTATEGMLRIEITKDSQFERKSFFFSPFAFQVQKANRCRMRSAALKEARDSLEIWMKACVKMTTVFFSTLISLCLSFTQR